MSKPRPRPVRSEYLRVRLSPAEVAAATKAALKLERDLGRPYSLSDFVRDAVHEKAREAVAAKA